MSPILLTSKRNAMRIPNYLGMLIGGYQNFVEQLVLNRWRHHCDVIDMLLKNDVIFSMASLVVWILYAGFFLILNYKMSKLNELRHKNVFLMLFKLNFDQKMLKFRKLVLENFKNRETFHYLCNFKFSEVIYDAFWPEVKLIWNKNMFWRKLLQKNERGQKCSSPCKIG